MPFDISEFIVDKNKVKKPKTKTDNASEGSERTDKECETKPWEPPTEQNKFDESLYEGFIPATEKVEIQKEMQSPRPHNPNKTKRPPIEKSKVACTMCDKIDQIHVIYAKEIKNHVCDDCIRKSMRANIR